MIEYIAFLRGINVGGKNLIKMDQLSKIFELSGYKNVRTYIQSGNVLFESNETNPKSMVKEIEKELHKILTDDVIVALRSAEQLKSIVKSSPFNKFKYAPTAKLYISLLRNELNQKPELPLLSIKKDVEILHTTKQDVFCIAHEINGKFGFPNNFIEKKFNIQATTRNWNTILKISELINH